MKALTLLILAASTPTNTPGRFDRTNSRSIVGRTARGTVGSGCSQCVCANATNYARQSQAMNNAAWTAQGGATITGSDGSPAFAAPDGSNNAQLLTVASCPGIESNIFQLQNIGAGTVTGSVWIRGTGTISVSIYDANSASGNAAQCTATPFWTQCSVTRTTINPTYITIGCNNSAGYIGNANTGAASLYIWQGQMEIGAGVATCPIATTTNPVTRSGTCSAVCQ